MHKKLEKVIDDEEGDPKKIIANEYIIVFNDKVTKAKGEH